MSETEAAPQSPATPEALWAQTRAAVAAKDDEAADRHWREFVRMLWQTMPGVPWAKPAMDQEVRA